MSGFASLITGLVFATTVLSGCSELRYYVQSARGHQYIVDHAQDIEQLLTDDQLDADLQQKLNLILNARKFASETLGLPENGSYTRYADLGRDYVVKNLFAAEEFSTELHSWCYLVIGCAQYRGYFDEQMLVEYRDELSGEGYDTYIADVAAYSTLGWFDDPALNTFIGWPEYRLVGLIFHELAHQKIYIDGDTFFNESFAMTVEQAGVRAWFASTDNPEQLSQYHAHQKRHDVVLALVTQARKELDTLYQQQYSDEEKRLHKEKIIQNLRQQYAVHARSWSNREAAATFPGEINNARLGMMVAYNRFVPAFLSILKDQENNLQLFYAYVSDLSELPAEQRKQCLQAWSKQAGVEPGEDPSLCQLVTD